MSSLSNPLLRVRTSAPTWWRGPHDPPGTCFRARQTFEVYGYWPSACATVEFNEHFVCDIGLIGEAEKFHGADVFPIPVIEDEDEVNPIISLVEARLLVEECVRNLTGRETQHLMPYLEALELSIAVLKNQASEFSELSDWLAKNGL